MARSYAAIDAVMGRLFDERQRQAPAYRLGSRSKGKSAPAAKGRFSSARMSRMGAKDGNAVFKLVRGAGVKNASGLRGQLNYIFRDDKVARIIDPTNNIKEYDTDMSDKQIARTVRDLSDNWWSNTRNGNTAHMILSFPQSVSIEDATQITRAVCEEKFNSGDQKYGYIVAIHDDQAHHPHAHIILNRRADDGTLFHMRAGTEHSYEAMREAMAAHAERRGILLDPTNRFERGIIDRQPSREEQVTAQKEGRAPNQRPRVGDDLIYAKEQLSYGKIMLEGLAVIAANADCERMERAYREAASIFETSNGDIQMPELTSTEIEQFNSYAELLNDTLQHGQDMLTTTEAPERVPLEVQLTDIMSRYSALSPDAEYSKSIHQPASGNSIYRHLVSEDKAQWEAGQGRLKEIADQYGLDGRAVSARLEANATSAYLERMWVQDDLKTVAKNNDLNIDDPAERQAAISELTNAYQVIREEMLERSAIQSVAHLEPVYSRNDYSTLNKEEMNEIHDALKGADYGYSHTDNADQREQGRQTVEEAEKSFETFANRSLVHASYASDVWDQYAQDHLTRPDGYIAADLRTDYREPEIDQDGQRILTVVEERNFDAAFSQIAQGDIPGPAVKFVFEEFAQNSPDHAEYGSNVWDEKYEYPVTLEPSGQTLPLEGYVGPNVELERKGPNEADPFAAYRGRDQYELSDDGKEHREIIALLKETLTENEYERFRNGDLTAVEQITDDTTMQRQLLAEVDMDNRASGYETDKATQLAMDENNEELAKKFPSENTNEYDR